MKSTILLVDLTSDWIHRQVVHYEGSKWDADIFAYQLAEQFGFKTMRHHQTTIRFQHVVTLFGTRKPRRSALDQLDGLAQAGLVGWLLGLVPQLATITAGA